MISILTNPQGQILWSSVGGLLLACLFLIGGIFRVVEFQGLGLSVVQRSLLIPIHILGCLLFSTVMALLLMDTHGQFKTIMNSCFGLSVVTLFPIHIFIGLKRRIKLKDSGFLQV